MPDANKQAGPSYTLGRTGKPAHALGLGCWQFGGDQWGGQDDDASVAAMGAALEAGVNHVDTAIGYGNGKSEQFVGRFLEESGARDDVLLASKQLVQDTADEWVQAVEASLGRLKVDMIDLYYFHWPKTGADMRPHMQAAEKLREQGKIHAIGVSNFTPEQMDQMREVGTIDAHQLCYSLAWRPLEDAVIPYGVEHDIDIVTYSSLGQGLLTGKFGPDRPEFPEGDQRDEVTLFDRNAWPKVYAAVEKMQAVADREDRPLAHLAMQWVAAQDGVKSVLFGVRSADQLDRNLGALADPVGKDVLDELTRISDDIAKALPDTGNIFKFYP